MLQRVPASRRYGFYSEIASGNDAEKPERVACRAFYEIGEVLVLAHKRNSTTTLLCPAFLWLAFLVFSCSCLQLGWCPNNGPICGLAEGMATSLVLIVAGWETKMGKSSATSPTAPVTSAGTVSQLRKYFAPQLLIQFYYKININIRSTTCTHILICTQSLGNINYMHCNVKEGTQIVY